MKAEHIKQWVNLKYPPEPLDDNTAKPEPQPEALDALCTMIRHVFQHQELGPQELPWSLLAVLPKPCGGSRGIGLIEFVWKLIEAIMDNWIKATIDFHDILHGFRS